MSALPSPQERAEWASEEAYPHDPLLREVYAKGFERGWREAVALNEQYEQDPPDTVYGPPA